MSQIPKEILKKLQDIKNLADPERGGKPGEIESALSILQKQLRKYNIELAQLDDLTPSINITDEVLTEDHLQRWKKELIYTISKHNGCQVLVYDNPDPDRIAADGFFVVAGQPHNVTVVRELYTWLASELPRMAYDAWLEERKKPYPELDSGDDRFTSWFARQRRLQVDQESYETAWEDPAEWRQSYISGVIWGWDRKLDEATRNASAQDATGSELMVIKDQEVLKYVNEKFSTEKVSLNSKNYAHKAYAEGMKRGEQLPVEKQVGGETHEAIGG